MKFARAIFKYNQNHNFYGCVNFYQKGKNDSVLVEYNIFDNSFLPVSINRRIVVRGLHIHDKYLTPREIENNKCGEACAHFNNGKPIYSRLNTNGTKHGYHTGDLKFNAIFENGVCKELFFDDKISLYPGYKNCILKKSLVLHENTDDCGCGQGRDREESWMTGNAGGRLACTNIEEVSNFYIHSNFFKQCEDIKKDRPLTDFEKKYRIFIF